MGKPRKKTKLELATVRDGRIPRLRDAKKSQIIARDIKRDKALELYLQHKSYRTIALELGIDPTTAFEMVNSKYEQRLAACTEKAAMVRDRQNAQIMEVIERWLPLALSEDLNVGEKRLNKKGEEYDVSLSSWEASAKATELVLKAWDSQAKIHGLHTLKIEHKADPVLTGQLYAQIHDQVKALAERTKEKQLEAIEI